MTQSVSAAECAEIRRAIDRGKSLKELANDYQLEYAVVKHHVWGYCSHQVDEPAKPIE